MKNLSKKTKAFIIMSLIAIVIVFALVIIIVINNQEWKLEGNIIKRGNQKYEIGDYYEYDETIDNRLENVTDVKWKVYGVDEEGNLLIMSASSVEQLTLGSEKDLNKAQQDILTADKKMEKIAQKYGKGDNAVYARPVSTNDINELTGYKQIENNKSITFYWGADSNPITVNENGEIVSIKLNYNNVFYWLNNNNWMKNEKKGTETNEELKPINTFKSDLIMYDNQNYDTLSFYIKEKSKLFNMLYLDDNNERAIYWTTTRYTAVSNNYIAYGYNAVKFDTLNADNLVYSSGDTNEITRGVRVIVAVK